MRKHTYRAVRQLIVSIMLPAWIMLAAGGCVQPVLTQPTDARTCTPACSASSGEAASSADVPVDAVLVSGNLCHTCGSISYGFYAKQGMRLAWSLSGPPAHTVLTYPNGDSDGPSLPSVIALPTSGRYIFSLSSNTMAEGIDGPFRLVLRLLPANQ